MSLEAQTLVSTAELQCRIDHQLSTLAHASWVVLIPDIYRNDGDEQCQQFAKRYLPNSLTHAPLDFESSMASVIAATRPALSVAFGDAVYDEVDWLMFRILHFACNQSVRKVPDALVYAYGDHYCLHRPCPQWRSRMQRRKMVPSKYQMSHTPEPNIDFRTSITAMHWDLAQDNIQNHRFLPRHPTHHERAQLLQRILST